MSLPGNSDVNLFRYREGIIYLNAEVSDGAFNLGVAEQELYGSQVAGSAVDQRRECVPKSFGSSPILAIHSDRSRAYCRVVMH
jgi:hypothetical protein